MLDLVRLCGKALPDQYRVVAYARVSSHDQKADLQRQSDRLEQHCREVGYANLELVANVIESMTVFSARLYGSRSLKNPATLGAKNGLNMYK